jgi:hypothetical protein
LVAVSVLLIQLRRVEFVTWGEMATRSVETELPGVGIEPFEVGGPELVTVVLPCLNEEDSVGLVVREALETLRVASLPGEVLVVDNGSHDKSAEVACLAGARVIHEPRRGYGRALRSGIAAAAGSIVVMADADWTYDMRKIPLLVGPILRGEADITIGSRLHEATRDTMPLLHRYVGTPALTALVRQAGGYRQIPDSQSGFRCFRKQAVVTLALNSDGMEFASEMLIKSSRHRLRVANVATGYRKRIGTSKLNTLADGWRHLRLILLLAPELLLLAPGSLLVAIGLILSAAEFLPSRGVVIGSLRWQPTFFASIALVLGTQAILVGLAFLWHRIKATGPAVRHSLAFIRARPFPRVCSGVGFVLMSVGLALDVLLFIKWIGGGASDTFDMALASLAQSLLLVGGSIASFGLVVMWLRWDEGQTQDRE